MQFILSILAAIVQFLCSMCKVISFALLKSDRLTQSHYLILSLISNYWLNIVFRSAEETHLHVVDLGKQESGGWLGFQFRTA